MIIFNDSIPVQPPKVASAVCKCQGFCRGMSMLFSIVSAKKKKKKKRKIPMHLNPQKSLKNAPLRIKYIFA